MSHIPLVLADPTAVVTADLLKATNEIVDGLVVSGGAVTTVTTTDADGNGALTISPTSGNVVVEIATAENDGSTYGVVSVATDSDITLTVLPVLVPLLPQSN